MSEHVVTVEPAALDRLLADLEPKPCPSGCEDGYHVGSYPTDADPCGECDTLGTVPGVAVIPLREEPTEADFDLSGRFVGVRRADRLTIREADQPCPQCHGSTFVGTMRHGGTMSNCHYCTPPDHPENEREERARAGWIAGRTVSVRVVGWENGQAEVTR